MVSDIHVNTHLPSSILSDHTWGILAELRFTYLRHINILFFHRQNVVICMQNLAILYLDTVLYITVPCFMHILYDMSACGCVWAEATKQIKNEKLY